MNILPGLPRIDALAELLIATPRCDIQRQHVDTTHTSDSNLRHIINDILDVANIEAGRLLLEYIAFDPRQAVGMMGGQRRHRSARGEDTTSWFTPPRDSPAHLGKSQRRAPSRVTYTDTSTAAMNRPWATDY